MTIRNSLGQTSYQRFMTRGREGDPGVAGVESHDMINPILVQLGTITIGGTKSDGDFVTVFTDTRTGEVVTVTTTRATTPDSNADIAAQHAADINATEALKNVVDAAINGSTAEQIDLTFLHAGRVYTVACSETTATSTITPAVTQVAGGSARTVARFVRRNGVSSGRPIVADLASTSVAADVAGILLQRLGLPVNLEGSLDSDSDQEPAGTVVPVAYNKSVLMKKADSGTVNAGDTVYAVRAITGGDALGQVRGTPDGVQHIIDISPTEVNDQQYAIKVDLIDESTGKVVTSAYSQVLGDASATETEIATLMKTDVDAQDLVTVWGCTTALDGTGDNKSLQITAPLGYKLVGEDTGVGVTVVSDDTAFAMYTIKLDKNQAEFGEQIVGAGSIGEVRLKNL